MFSLLKTDRSRTLFLKTTMLSKLLQVFFLNRCDVSGNKLVLFKCCLPQTTDDKTDKNNLKWKLTVFMSNCIASFLDELGLGITGQYQYPVYQWYQYHCSWSKWPLRQVIIFLLSSKGDLFKSSIDVFISRQSSSSSRTHHVFIWMFL